MVCQSFWLSDSVCAQWLLTVFLLADAQRDRDDATTVKKSESKPNKLYKLKQLKRKKQNKLKQKIHSESKETR